MSHVGNQANHVVEAYLYSATFNKTKHIAQKHSWHRVSKQRILKSPYKVRRRIITHTKIQLKRHAASHKVQTSHMLTPGMRSLLLQKLHDAVAKNLVYPSQATWLNLTGVTTLSFTLMPSGIISNIAIIKSSHSQLLDQAAMTTLGKISPFVIAKKYIHTAQRFTIDIKFEI